MKVDLTIGFKDDYLPKSVHYFSIHVNVYEAQEDKSDEAIQKRFSSFKKSTPSLDAFGLTSTVQHRLTLTIEDLPTITDLLGKLHRAVRWNPEQEFNALYVFNQDFSRHNTFFEQIDSNNHVTKATIIPGKLTNENASDSFENMITAFVNPAMFRQNDDDNRDLMDILSALTKFDDKKTINLFLDSLSKHTGIRYEPNAKGKLVEASKPGLSLFATAAFALSATAVAYAGMEIGKKMMGPK